ncbi:MAG: hypothetical protein U1F14_10705 [Steroidobacteraceae bacterium]
MERDEDHFDLDEDFLSGDEDAQAADRFLDKRVKPGASKKGQAAWSRLEDLLAERRLERELRELFGDEG